MKRFLTMFLSLLCFSVMTANNIRFNDSKDVTKQKTEVSTFLSQDIQVGSLEVINFTNLSANSNEVITVTLKKNETRQMSPANISDDVGWRKNSYSVDKNYIADKYFQKSNYLIPINLNRQTFIVRN
jgi:hypothetical protein